MLDGAEEGHRHRQSTGSSQLGTWKISGQWTGTLPSAGLGSDQVIVGLCQLDHGGLIKMYITNHYPNGSKCLVDSAQY